MQYSGKTVYSRDLPGLRFVPRSDVFRSRASVPENDCFCPDEDMCDSLGDGMFGISPCQFGAPIVLSWPHFLHAEDKFTKSVEGLKPNKEKPAFYVDIQPTTGTRNSSM